MKKSEFVIYSFFIFCKTCALSKLEGDTGVDFQTSPAKLNLVRSQSHEKTGGKIPSRSTPGRMTFISSHSGLFYFILFFLAEICQLQ